MRSLQYFNDAPAGNDPTTQEYTPRRHVLHSGETVIQHIYETHFEGVEEVEEARRAWAGLANLMDPARRTGRTDPASQCGNALETQSKEIMRSPMTG